METSQTIALLDRIGKMKVVTVFLGIFSVAFTGASYKFENGMDEFGMAMVCLAFVLSILLVVAIVVEIIPVTEVWRKFDMVYHGLMGALLTLAVLFMTIRLFSAKGEGAGNSVERVLAIIVTILNTAAYIFVAIGIYKTPGVN